MLDLEALGDGLADLVLDAVERATAPLIARIAALEAKPAVEPLSKAWDQRFEAFETKLAETVERTKAAAAVIEDRMEATNRNIEARFAGEQPKHLTVEDVDGIVRAAIVALPLPEKGDPGQPGPPPTDEQIASAIERALEPREGIESPIAVQVQRYMEAFPPPPPEKGEKGDPGKDAEPITDEQIAAAVEKWLEANPPANGKDGTDGKDGEKGDPGKDGIGLAGALIDRSGNLVVTMTDGTTRDLGPVEGSDGKDGKDGSDGKDGEPGPAGFSLEDFDSEIRDGGRTLVLSFTAGDTKHTVEHQLDTMIYRGAYKAGAEYLPGDTVSCGGQLHHCNTQTTDRPDGGSDSWVLCSRRGRDGKDADPTPMLRLIEDKFKDAEDSLMKRVEAYLRSKGA